MLYNFSVVMLVFTVPLYIKLQDRDKSTSLCIKQTTRQGHVDTRYRQSHRPTHNRVTQKHKSFASNARSVFVNF